jgi:hypothetical protein
MKVVLGDGRTVECPTGIRRLPSGPMPDVLASEVARPMSGVPASMRDIDWHPPIMRANATSATGDSVPAPVPVMLRARFDKSLPAECAQEAPRAA